MSETTASYAVNENISSGRRFAEPKHSYRADFERDRDRIIHSAAFRRLEGKTQVFTPGINDFYRTRFTHSIEVAQIGRTIAKALNLNEALTEAICLGHDLGHSPFGHNGEKTLNNLMKDFGGFEHNKQTLRIVDLLERPYPDFAGLNLMYETRLGLAKHRSTYDESAEDFFTEKNCSLEGQVADLADRIAYNCHDLEDGMRAELISEKQIGEIKICFDAAQKCNAAGIADVYIRDTRIAKTIIDLLVSDCIESSRKKINIQKISSPQDVYSKSENIICLSSSADAELVELEHFLLHNMYEHPFLQPVAKQVSEWLKKVFEKFCRSPKLMPKHYQCLIEDFGIERTVCDYISSMTDWYCLSISEQD